MTERNLLWETTRNDELAKAGIDMMWLWDEELGDYRLVNTDD